MGCGAEGGQAETLVAVLEMRQRSYPSQKASLLLARATIASTTAAVQGASAAAAVTEAVDETVATAVTGDLVTSNPYISAKIAEIEGRIDDLEPPP